MVETAKPASATRNPTNGFCCTRCNSDKGASWASGGKVLRRRGGLGTRNAQTATSFVEQTRGQIKDLDEAFDRVLARKGKQGLIAECALTRDAMVHSRHVVVRQDEPPIRCAANGLSG